MSLHAGIWIVALAAVLAASLLATSATVRAQTLERLVMPGPLTGPHAKYEDKCESCHEPFAKVSQNDLCLDCHKEVGKDIAAGSGFHGLFPAVKSGECKACHTDHKGRDFDIVGLDSETFDHGFTDYPLGPAHAGLECTACHKAPAKFRDAPTSCFGCHETSDPHKGSLGNKCETCHNDTTWSKISFDHNTTKFALTGQHKDVSCDACHPNQRFANAPQRCVACHAIDDAHGGLFGDKCENCHTVADKWARSSFVHDAKTGFALHASHAKLACRACHTGDLYGQKLQTGCIDCHGADDVHKGRNGTDCKSCHGEDSWKKASFDHDKDTDFPLTGGHQKLACSACHIGETRAASLATTCSSCHTADDVHRGRLGNDCAACHTERKWSEALFDHDLAKFPLIGLHAALTCQQCHLDQTFAEVSSTCFSCHQADDTHKGVLGQDCAACHNPNGWSFWRFDHATQTDFPLDGTHQGLACAACHVKPVKGKAVASSTCQSCHRRDDIHRGQFGPSCEQCHSTQSFKSIRMRQKQ